MTILGYVSAKGIIGNPRKTAVQEVEFLANTGASHTAIPPQMAEELGIEVVAEINIILADKREVKAGIGLAYIRILDRESILPVAVLDVPKPLLGVSTFEGLGVKVDPITGRLEHARSFGVALL